jgi:transposase-like protein
MAASDQAELFEARRTLTADDEMVVHLQAENAGGVHDPAGHLDIGP